MSFHAGLVARRDNRVDKPITAAIGQIRLIEAENTKICLYAGNVK